jgi:hypothetical protein
MLKVIILAIIVLKSAVYDQIKVLIRLIIETQILYSHGITGHR